MNCKWLTYLAIGRVIYMIQRLIDEGYTLLLRTTESEWFPY